MVYILRLQALVETKSYQTQTAISLGSIDSIKFNRKDHTAKSFYSSNKMHNIDSEHRPIGILGHN